MTFSHTMSLSVVLVGEFEFELGVVVVDDIVGVMGIGLGLLPLFHCHVGVWGVVEIVMVGVVMVIF